MTKELTTINGIVAALYDAVSFESGGEPNYQLLRSLFHADGRVIPPIEDTGSILNPLTVDEFIKKFHSTLQAEGLLAIGGIEAEIARRTISFGRVVHVASSYNFTLVGSEKPLARGVNMMQLVFYGERWWILSLTWDRAKTHEALTIIEYSR